MSKRKQLDLVQFTMDYEAGELSDEAIIEGFQYLIDHDIVWQLQGHYGRVALSLIQCGYCTRKAGK